MPSADPSPARRPALADGPPSRRAVVTAGLGGLAAGTVLWGTSGCRLRIGSPSSGGPPGGGSTPPPPAQTAGAEELATAAAVATVLQEAYQQGIAVRPDLSGPLGRLLDDHSTHLRALDALGVSVPDATADPSVTGPSSSATTALSVLAQLERTAVASALQDIAGVDGRTARLLASIGACRSSHVTLLARLPATPPTATAKAGG